MMTDRQFKMICNIVFVAIGSALLAWGVNWQVGVAIVFLFWALAGLMEVYID